MGQVQSQIPGQSYSDVEPVPYAAKEEFLEKFKSSGYRTDGASFIVIDCLNHDRNPDLRLADLVFVVSFSSVHRGVSCCTVVTEFEFIVEIVIIAMNSIRVDGSHLNIYMPDTYAFIGAMAVRKEAISYDDLMCVCSSIISVRDVTIAVPGDNNRGSVSKLRDIRKHWGLVYRDSSAENLRMLSVSQVGMSCTRMFSMAAATMNKIARFQLDVNSFYNSQKVAAICAKGGFPVNEKNYRFMIDDMDSYHAQTFLKACQLLATKTQVTISSGQESRGIEIARELGDPNLEAWFVHARRAAGKKASAVSMLSDLPVGANWYRPLLYPETMTGRLNSMTRAQPLGITKAAISKYKIFENDKEVEVLSADFKYQEIMILNAFAQGTFDGSYDPYVGLADGLAKAKHFKFDNLDRSVLKLAVLRTIYGSGAIAVHELLTGVRLMDKAQAMITMDIVKSHMSSVLGVDFSKVESMAKERASTSVGLCASHVSRRRIKVPLGDSYKSLNKAIQTIAAEMFHYCVESLAVCAYMDAVPIKLAMPRYDEVWVTCTTGQEEEMGDIVKDYLQSASKEFLGTMVSVKVEKIS